MKVVVFNDALLSMRKLTPFDKIHLLFATRLILLHYAMSLLQILRMRHNESRHRCGHTIRMVIGYPPFPSVCVVLLLSFTSVCIMYMYLVHKMNADATKVDDMDMERCCRAKENF